MRLSLPVTTMILATAASSMPSTAEARSYGRLVASSSPTGRRTYQYSRPRDGLDVVSDVLLSPIFNWHNDANSLLRQHASALLSSAASMSATSDAGPHQQQSEGDSSSSSSSPQVLLITPPYTVFENTKTGSMELSMEIPGVAAKDLSIELENGTLLRITGSRNQKNAHGDIVESSKFDQTFQLDNDVDPERLEVLLSHGVLSVSVPKKEKIVKRIAIKTVDALEEYVEVETKATNEESVAPGKAVDGAQVEEVVELDDKAK